MLLEVAMKVIANVHKVRLVTISETGNKHALICEL
jgi:hypothetical protein